MSRGGQASFLIATPSHADHTISGSTACGPFRSCSDTPGATHAQRLTGVGKRGTWHLVAHARYVPEPYS